MELDKYIRQILIENGVAIVTLLDLSEESSFLSKRSAFDFATPSFSQIIIPFHKDLTSNTLELAFKKSYLNVVRWGPATISVWSLKEERYLHFHCVSEFISETEKQDFLLTWRSLLVERNFTLPFFYPKMKNLWLGGANTDEPPITSDRQMIRRKRIEEQTLLMYFLKNAPSIFILESLDTISSFPLEEVTKSLDKTKLNPDIFRAALVDALKTSKPSRFLRRMNTLGILERFMPELTGNIGCHQNPEWHTEDVFDHLMRTVDCAGEFTQDPMVKLAALLHDVGKAATRKESLA